jgi:16S rRNA (cytosine967-C5)-methyltransferase
MAPNKLQSQTGSCAKIALAILGEALTSSKPADRLLGNIMRANHQLGSRDRRFISETVFSVLRWWGWLKPLAPTTYASPHGWERVFLAAWLLEGEKLPEASWLWLPKSGLTERQIPLILEQPDAVARFRKLQIYWEQRFEFSWETLIPAWSLGEIKAPPHGMPALISQLQARPPVWLRPQTNDLDKLIGELVCAGVQVEKFSKDFPALKLTSPRVNLRTLPAFAAGNFEIQDISSQVIGAVCAAKPGERWWDACAGAGGKSLQLGWQMQSRGTIIATDLRAHKLEELAERARRARLSNIRGKEWNDTLPPPSKTPFDGVLVDAPCSCSGTWRRNPDARWSTQREELAELTQLQGRILDAAVPGVAPGGRLVYATCSMFTRENGGVVEAFLKRHSDFRLEPFENPLTGQRTPGTLQIWPGQVDGDAMYVARFHRDKAL